MFDIQPGLRKKNVKKMMEWSVKKEIIPIKGSHPGQDVAEQSRRSGISLKRFGKFNNAPVKEPAYRQRQALISFSRMESFLDLFSTALIFSPKGSLWELRFVSRQNEGRKEVETTHILPKKLKPEAGASKYALPSRSLVTSK